MAKRTPAKRNGKKLKCKKGSFPVEIEIGKKKVIVCGRLTEEEVREVKKQVKKAKASGLDWGYGVMAVLDVLGTVVQGFGHLH